MILIDKMGFSILIEGGFVLVVIVAGGLPLDLFAVEEKPFSCLSSSLPQRGSSMDDNQVLRESSACGNHFFWSFRRLCKKALDLVQTYV